MRHAVFFLKARPTPAQAEAGNYKMKRHLFQGLPVSIENPKGSVRSGVDRTGKAWRTRMQHDYGYIRGTIGRDKDHLDCYVGPCANASHAHIIHQRKAGQWQEHDEDKVMLGFDSTNAAQAAYMAHYDDPRFMGPITKMPMAEFIRRCREHKGAMPPPES